MKKWSLLFSILLVVGSFSSTLAVDQTGKFSLGGTVGYSLGLGDAFTEYKDYELRSQYRTYKVNFSLGIKFNYGISRNFAIGGIIEGQSGELTEKNYYGIVNHRSYDWLNLLANVDFRLSQEEKIVPYLGGGIGFYVAEENDLQGEQIAVVGIHIGGGMEYFLKNNLALDVGARFHRIFNGIVRYTDFPEDKNITYINIYAGLNVYLGTK
jgi:opacity protein-like surface antigen